MANIFNDLFGAARNAPKSQADLCEQNRESLHMRYPANQINAGTQISGIQVSGTQALGRQVFNMHYPSPISNIKFTVAKVRNGYTLDVDGEAYIAKDISEVVVVITSQIAAMELKAASNK